MPWLYLSLASVSEIGFAYFLVKSDGFSHRAYTIAFFTTASISFYCFSKAVQQIPIGIAYTIWVSIGVVASQLVGHFAFQEHFSWLKAFLVFLILVSAIGLKLLSR